jgi:hypothetical protein
MWDWGAHARRARKPVRLGLSGPSPKTPRRYGIAYTFVGHSARARNAAREACALPRDIVRQHHERNAKAHNTAMSALIAVAIAEVQADLR